ncbi:uncharacterized protein LOC105197310 [Solenopsis invicta]|uniref:uncharacterized protein LOC105197310 n=1 Tax=Solenopsis invicta TaxID=13686 RepID=UPI00193D5C7B|nr:uncharacterized protein LOC105197310 [Solenopsis invicta]
MSKNSSEYRYVMMFKSVVDQELLPNDFDVWTIKEQCIWINKNIPTFFPNTPKSALHLMPAFCRLTNCKRSLVETPEWLDIDKYRKGQKFVRENYTSIMIGTVLGTLLLYTFEEDLNPLIITKRSITPYLALKRYFSNLQRFSSWYSGEPWIEGTQAYRDMQYTCKMHFLVQAKLSKLDDNQFESEAEIVKPWCPDHELLLKDFAAVCPFNPQSSYQMINKTPYKLKNLNNANMALTQCFFLSVVLLWPQNIGIHNATNEEIEAFCHMWRCYGYFLGIEDEYNICRGNLEEIKDRTRDLYELMSSNFNNITPKWEHMTRCFIESLNYYPLLYMPYKMVVVFTMDAINISMPHLYASMSYAEWITYKISRFFFRYAFKFSIIRSIINKVINKIFDKVMNFNPEKKAELQEKSKQQLLKFSMKH